MPALQLAMVSSHGGGLSSAGWMVASMIATPPTNRSHLALKVETAGSRPRWGQFHQSCFGNGGSRLQV